MRTLGEGVIGILHRTPQSAALPASVCVALRAPWRERLRCTQTAALAYALLHLPPAAQGDATPSGEPDLRSAQDDSGKVEITLSF